MIQIKTNNKRLLAMLACYPAKFKAAVAQAFSEIGKPAKFKNSTPDLEFEYEIEFSCADSFTIFKGDYFIGTGEIILTKEMILQSEVELVAHGQ